MSNSIGQALTTAAACLLFCIAITLLLFELKQIYLLEAEAERQEGIVKELVLNEY